MDKLTSVLRPRSDSLTSNPASGTGNSGAPASQQEPGTPVPQVTQKLTPEASLPVVEGNGNANAFHASEHNASQPVVIERQALPAIERRDGMPAPTGGERVVHDQNEPFNPYANMSDDSVVAVAAALPSNMTLTRLDLGHNHVGAVGAAALAVALAANTMLPTLILNPVGSEQP